MSISILYEDRDVCVCLKPCGIVSEEGGLPDRLSAALGGSFYCVHRLDKAVGGVMVYARNERAAAALSQQTAERKMEKLYLAVIPDALENDSGLMEDLLYRDKAKNKSYVVKRMRRGVKDARLEYRILERREGLALVQVRLHTGRSHQIRCQLASRRCPILGDGKYGSALRTDEIALWSAFLAFEHPAKRERMEFSALPQGAFWERFDYCTQAQV